MARYNPYMDAYFNSANTSTLPYFKDEVADRIVQKEVKANRYKPSAILDTWNKAFIFSATNSFMYEGYNALRTNIEEFTESFDEEAEMITPEEAWDRYGVRIKEPQYRKIVERWQTENFIANEAMKDTMAAKDKGAVHIGTAIVGALSAYINPIDAAIGGAAVKGIGAVASALAKPGASVMKAGNLTKQTMYAGLAKGQQFKSAVRARALKAGIAQEKVSFVERVAAGVAKEQKASQAALKAKLKTKWDPIIKQDRIVQKGINKAKKQFDDQEAWSKLSRTQRAIRTVGQTGAGAAIESVAHGYVAEQHGIEFDRVNAAGMAFFMGGFLSGLGALSSKPKAPTRKPVLSAEEVRGGITRSESKLKELDISAMEQIKGITLKREAKQRILDSGYKTNKEIDAAVDAEIARSKELEGDYEPEAFAQYGRAGGRVQITKEEYSGLLREKSEDVAFAQAYKNFEQAEVATWKQKLRGKSLAEKNEIRQSEEYLEFIGKQEAYKKRAREIQKREKTRRDAGFFVITDMSTGKPVYKIKMDAKRYYLVNKMADADGKYIEGAATSMSLSVKSGIAKKWKQIKKEQKFKEKKVKDTTKKHTENRKKLITNAEAKIDQAIYNLETPEGRAAIERDIWTLLAMPTTKANKALIKEIVKNMPELSKKVLDARKFRLTKRNIEVIGGVWETVRRFSARSKFWSNMQKKISANIRHMREVFDLPDRIQHYSKQREAFIRLRLDAQKRLNTMSKKETPEARAARKELSDTIKKLDALVENTGYMGAQSAFKNYILQEDLKLWFQQAASYTKDPEGYFWGVLEDQLVELQAAIAMNGSKASVIDLLPHFKDVEQMQRMLDEWGSDITRRGDIDGLMKHLLSVKPDDLDRIIDDINAGAMLDNTNRQMPSNREVDNRSLGLKQDDVLGDIEAYGLPEQQAAVSIGKRYVDALDAFRKCTKGAG